MTNTNDPKQGLDLRGVCPLLLVYDMPTSIHFYCDVLGFKVMGDYREDRQYEWVLLRLHNTELMLEPIYPAAKRPALPDPARTQAHADTALYFGCPDPDAAYVHLRKHGIEVEKPRVASYGMKQLYLRDPDGYQICFQWAYSQQSIDQWKEWYDPDPDRAT